MHINSKTFCSAPWFHLRNTNTNEYRACCLADITKTEFIGATKLGYPTTQPENWVNSEYMQYIRKELSDGNQINECSKCWQHEKNGLPSLRHTYNNTVTNNRGNELDKTWVSLYFKNKKDYTTDLLLSVDVKLTNLCNFSCAMCNPADSSQLYTKWQQTKKSSWIQYNLQQTPTYLNEVRQTFIDKQNYKLLEYAIAKHALHIKVLGGEPLIDNKMLEMLTAMPEKQKNKTALTFVTNGSVSLSMVCKLLGNFKHIHFTLSLEGIGKVQDWLRQGSVWKDIEKNVEEFSSVAKDNTSIGVHHTIQALSMLHIDQLVNWVSARNISLTFCILTNPVYLSVALVPEDIRTIFYRKLTNLPKLISNAYDTEDSVDVKNLSTLINSIPVDTSAYYLLEQFLEWYDPDHNWKTVFPEWKKYLNQPVN